MLDNFTRRRPSIGAFRLPLIAAAASLAVFAMPMPVFAQATDDPALKEVENSKFSTSGVIMSNAVFVDSREGAMKESGDLILSGAKIYAELGEALAGKVPPRTNETTIFKSLGMAVEDIAAAIVVYREVTEQSRSQSSGL